MALQVLWDRLLSDELTYNWVYTNLTHVLSTYLVSAS